MRKILLKLTFLTFLSFFFITNGSMAADNLLKESKEDVKITKTDKKANTVKSSKKVKKLTLREKFKLIKQVRKERRKLRKMGVKNDDQMILLYILAVLLPPVSVGIFTDWEAKPTLIDLLLTLIFWIPGVVYAFYILLS